MAVAINLTPTTIASADYPIAQTPALGGEKIVYLTTKASRLLGVGFLTSDDVVEWKYVNAPTASQGPIVAVAIDGGIQAAGAASPTITFSGGGGLTAAFTSVGWSANQTLFDFPAGRAVEFTGTTFPTSSSVNNLATSGMKQGSKFAIIEMPFYADFLLAGCTNNRSIKVPSRNTKSIPCGMNKAEWTTPGMTQEGNLEVTGLQMGVDDGLSRFRGTKCQAMLPTVREGRLITQRDFILDWTGEADENYPEGDSEATVALKGMFSKMVVLIAP
jgi:hypothetical protein